MAINERLVHTASAAGTGNQEEGLILHLDANDVDSYDGDGDVWYDIHDHEYTPATNVSEHFNTVTYTGNDGINEITGVGFQPDLVWIKRRNSSTYNHVIRDSVRGTDSVLSSDTNNAESVVSNRFEFITDGFKHLVGTQGANNSAGTYVAWCFNAGGAAAPNTNGYITSQVSANNDLGFSIAKYQGNGSSTGATVGHGLDTPPEMIIVKDLDATSDWAVYSSVTGNTKKLLLNSRNGAATSGVWNNTSPTSSVFTVRYSQTNEVNHDFAAYSFTSKRGVSKVGSYIGNGTTNNKIYTGFEPAFFMLKNTSLDNTGWLIKDNVRGENSKTLLANSNAAEYNTTAYWTCDFERDGVRLTYGADNEFNRNGDTYIFYAVAKDTNETSLIPDTDLELNLEADSYSGSGNWLDSSGNGNNGTINGATWEEELGNFFEFDGTNDTIEIGSSMYKSLPMTVEAWVNPLLTDNSVIYSNYDSSAIKGFYIRVNTSGQVFVDAYSNPSGTYQRTTAYSSENLTANKWSHVAVTFTTSYVTIYVNGESSGQSSTNANGITFTPSFSTLIGARGGTADEFYGKIGQVRAYSTELSLTQIRQNFNFTKNDYPNGINFTNAGGRANWLSEGSWNFDSGANEYFVCDTGAFQNRLGGSPFAFSAWLWTDTVASGFASIIEQRGYSDGSNNGFGIYRNGSSLEMYGRAAESTARQLVSVSSVFTASTWVHIVVQRTGTTWEVYVDGSSATNSGSYKDNATYQADDLGNGDATDSTLIISRQWQADTQQWDGKMADIKFFSKALTSAEVTAEYNKGQFGDN